MARPELQEDFYLLLIWRKVSGGRYSEEAPSKTRRAPPPRLPLPRAGLPPAEL